MKAGASPHGKSVSKFSARVINRADQIVQTHVWYDIVAEVGRLSRINTSFDLRYLLSCGAVLMLELCRVREPKFYGTYELDSFTDSSPRLIDRRKTRSS